MNEPTLRDALNTRYPMQEAMMASEDMIERSLPLESISAMGLLRSHFPPALRRSHFIDAAVMG